VRGILSRRQLLTVAASGAALVALPVRPASAATDDDLAYANLAVSAELLLADLYEKALAVEALTGSERVALRSGRRAALRHTRALAGLLTGAGQDAPSAEDFDFQWPEKAFSTPAAIASTARVVLGTMLGVYQTAVVAVTEESHRILYASLAASAGQQSGALTALAASGVVEPFPVALDLERASATLEPYLG
jgi:hypothetical protein